MGKPRKKRQRMEEKKGEPGKDGEKTWKKRRKNQEHWWKTEERENTEERWKECQGKEDQCSQQGQKAQWNGSEEKSQSERSARTEEKERDNGECW